MTYPILIFIISFIAILWSGAVLPETLASIARRLHLSEFFTAFILASFATSIPELFVALSSTFQGVPDLSVAAIIGSNVANMSIVIGLTVLIAGVLPLEGKISRQNYVLISFLSFLPLILLIDGVLGRLDGVILLIAFGLYIRKLFKDKEYFSKEMDTEEDGKPARVLNVFHLFGKFTAATIVLLVSSVVLVWSSKLIVAEYFNSDFVLFGIIFIALGTSLPEIAFGMQALFNGRGGATLGNILGSVAFNALGILGLLALIQPIPADFNAEYLVPTAFLILLFIAFHIFIHTRGKLKRTEGLVLILVYILFIFLTL